MTSGRPPEVVQSTEGARSQRSERLHSYVRDRVALVRHPDPKVGPHRTEDSSVNWMRGFRTPYTSESRVKPGPDTIRYRVSLPLEGGKEVEEERTHS